MTKINSSVKVELFQTLVKTFGCQCPLSSVIDIGKDRELCNIIASDDNPWFKIDGKQVSVCLPGLEICSKYSNGKPCNGNCKTLHLCKNHLLGDCNKGAKCKLFHRLKNDHNSSIFSRFHSEGLQEDEILLYLKQKLQQDEKCDSPSKMKKRKSRSRSRKRQSKTLTVTSEICIEGNKREEDPTVEETVNNGDANILQESVVEPTALKDDGGKNNDGVISAADAAYSSVKDFAELGSLGNVKAEATLPSNTETRKCGDVTDPICLDETQVPNYQGIKNETKELNRNAPKISENASSFTRNPIVDFSKPRQTIHRLAALRFLLQQEGGICLLSEFAEATGFTDSSAALQWIQSPDGRRVCKLFETRGQNDPLVVTSVLHLDLCPAYLSNKLCTDMLCASIHICKEFLEGNCLRQFCQHNHSITHFRNIKAFSLAGVELLNGPEILQAVKFSLPEICMSYNSEQGCNNLDCTKFHVCVEFVKGRCFLGRDDCNYEHTMSSFFNRKLSALYGKEEDVLLSILTASWHKELTTIPVVDKISMLPMILGIKKHSAQTGKTSKIAVPRNMNCHKVSIPNFNCTVQGEMDAKKLTPDPLSVPEPTIPQSTNPWQEATSQFYNHVPKTKCAEDSNSSVKSQGVVPSFTFGDFDGFDENLASMKESITPGTPYHDGQVKVGQELESQSPFSFSHFNENVPQPFEHKVSIKTPNLTYAGIVSKRKEEEQCTGASLKSNAALISAKRRARTSKTLQKEILNCLAQSPDGCYTLADLHRQLQNDFHTTVDLLTWLNGPMGKKMCVIQNAVTPHDTIVILRISKFQLCFDYMSKSGCTVKKCIFLHLCRRYVSDACEDDHCKYSHDTMSIHNREIVKNSGLTFDSNEDIRRAVMYSQPKVCENYNSTKGCQNAACNRFHICANYVQRICPFENCKKGHHLQTPRNIRLLTTLGFEERLGFKMMLVTCSTESAKIQSQLGSSYASGLNTIGTVNRLELLLCLLNHNQAHIPLEELATLEIFKDMSPADILTWLKSAEGREICKVFPTNYPEKYVVSLGIKSLQLCFGYCLPCGCQKEDCKFLHLCREYVAELCTRIHCKYSHGIRNDHNRNILKRVGVESFTDQNVVKAIRLSVPKVCMEYNSRMGCTQNVCTKFHVCADKVRRRCDSEKTCPKNHSLSSSHNRELLQMYDSTENTMHMMLLVTNEHALDSNMDRLEHICIEEFLPQVLRDHNGYCSIKQFLASFPVVLTNSEALDLLNKTKVQKYFIAFQHSGEMMVVAKGRLNLCFGYQGLEGCRNENCSYLHLCKDLLLGSCTRLKQCKLSHNIKNKYNAKILQGVGIAKNIANDLVLTFIKNSIPTVCPAHNTDEGCPSKLCRAFHICSNYVKQLCPKIAERCCFGHSFKTTHNQELLELYQSNRVLIKGRIIVADNME